MLRYFGYISVLLCILTFGAWSSHVAHAQGDVDDVLELIREQVQEARPGLDLGGSGSSDVDTLFNQIEQGRQTVEQFETGGVSLRVSPQTLEPFQEVTVSVEGYGPNLEEARYVWYVNGARTESGYGVKQIRTSLGGLGQTTRVRVLIERVEGGTIERETVMVPDSVDILWEAVDSHTPPFYRGKALPSFDSIVKLTAVSSLFSDSGSAVDPNSVVYTWEQNGRKRDMSEYSGYGGKTAYMYGSYLDRSHLASVEITDSASGIRTSGDAAIILREPQLFLYEKHPLGGVLYERALGNEVTTDDGSIRVVAEPFYLDQREPLDIEYGWNMNGSDLSNQGNMHRGEIQLVTEDDQTGRSILRVETENPSKMLQSVDRTLRINIE